MTVQMGFQGTSEVSCHDGNILAGAAVCVSSDKMDRFDPNFYVQLRTSTLDNRIPATFHPGNKLRSIVVGEGGYMLT